ncbi:hypothetical protein HZU75_14735 [Chitinibacter fontanus]|uniref:Cadherin domain-containing protein n=1 Tax=Chitinibacter fontanus TaxID=1737446 RepID=A0A7D5Z609_9NEIS|nr:VCBS domain-containing protein [Chitinibacter fontanus]QLI82681.1 hypothetical protein HZU75_14735 [Chitinibacter fontanus]
MKHHANTPPATTAEELAAKLKSLELPLGSHEVVRQGDEMAAVAWDIQEGASSRGPTAVANDSKFKSQQIPQSDVTESKPGSLQASAGAQPVSVDAHSAHAPILAISGQIPRYTDQGSENNFHQPSVLPGLNGHGVFSINVDGHWHYQLDANQSAITQLVPGKAINDYVHVVGGDGSTHSIAVSTTASNSTPLLQAQIQTVSEDGQLLLGKLDAADPDAGEVLSFSTTHLVVGFSLNADGSYRFDPSHVSYQHLAAGQTLDVLIPITVTDSAGATNTQNLLIIVTGTNDAAIIGGVDTGSITEDQAVNATGQLNAQGQLTLSDVDHGEAHFVAQTNTPGTYGVFTLDEHGAWTYTADNHQDAIQHLKASDTLTDQLTIDSADGTTHTITVEIVGSNDAPVLQAQTHAVTEDGAQLTGQMIATDVDTGDTQAFSIAQPVAGFTLNTDGSYRFDPSNAAYQHLAAGQTQDVVIPITVTDSAGATSTQHLTLTVTGTNDAAIIGGVDTGVVKEDVTQNVSGKLTITDVDDHEAVFDLTQSVQTDVYGHFTAAADGSWHYVLNNNAPNVQGQKEGEMSVDWLQMRSSDGALHTIMVTIEGSNDAPVLQAQSHAVVEDGSKLLGQLVATDADAGGILTFSMQQAVAGFSLAADGSYSFNPGDAAYQQLAAGETQLVTIPVIVTDAEGLTGQQNITITVTGTNDAAIIGGVDTGSITEDQAVNATGQLNAQGQLTLSDVDHGEAHFVAQTNTPGTYGVFTLDEHGAWTYTADNHQDAIQHLKASDTLTDQLTIDSADGTTHTITVEIVGSNDAPVLQAQTHAVTEDGAQLTGQMIATDVDTGDTQAFSIAQPVAGFTLNTDGSYRFDPSNAAYQHLAAGQTQDVVIPITVTDSAGATSTQHLTLTVTGTNDAAIIGGVDTGVVKEDVTQNVSGKLTITDVDDHEAVFDLTQSVQTDVYGHFTAAADGSWHYVLNNNAPNVQGQKEGEMSVDWLQMRSSDGALHTIMVTIEGSNDAPVLQAQSHAVVEDGSKLLGQLVATDADAGGILTFSMQQAVAGFSLAADGSYSFNPGDAAYQHLAAGETQLVTIPVIVTDAEGLTGQQNITITVTGTNDAAIIGGVDTGSITEDQAVNATGQLNAQGQLTLSDVDHGEAHFVAQTNTPGTYGVFTLDEHGAWTYTADNHQDAIQHLKASDTLTDQLTIDSADGTTHTITVEIVGSNDAPVLQAQTHAVTEDGAQLTGQMIATDVDTGDTQAFSIAQPVAGFTLNTDGSYRFDPSNAAYQHLAAGQTQDVVIPITVTDSAGATSTQHLTLTVTGTNDAAIIGGVDTGVVKEDVTQNVSGKLTITDVDDHEAVFDLTQSVQTDVYGHFTAAADGSWHYVLNNNAPNVQGQKEGEMSVDWLQMRSSDGALHTIMVTIEGSNDAPVLQAQSHAVVEDGSKLLGQLVATDADAGGILTFSMKQAVAGFSLAADGSYSFNPGDAAYQHLAAGETQLVTIPVIVTDAEGLTGQQNITITVTGTNDAAIIGGVDTGSITEDQAVNATGQLNAQGQLTLSDVDHGEAHFVAQTNTPGTYGVFTLDEHGAWTYTADNHQDAIQHLKASDTLTDQLTIDSADGTTHTITVEIVGSNDAPVLQAQTHAVTEDGAQLTGQMIATDVDTGDTQAFSIAQPVAGFTLNTDGSYRFDPSNAAYQHLAAGQTQDVVIPITVTDSAGATSTQHLTLTVTGTNDAAIIGGVDTGVVKEDVTQNVSGKLTITDVDDHEAVFDLTQSVQTDVYGHFTAAADGSWHYVLNNNAPNVQGQKEGEMSVDWLQMRSSDGALHTIMVTIEGSNDAPVLQAQSHAVVEDGSKLLGQLVATDADAGGILTFSMQQAVAGFSLAADGSYSFNPGDAAYQQLAAGETQLVTIPVIVTDAEGLTGQQNITITVTGTNDAAIIGGVDTGQVVEDQNVDSKGMLHASGQLQVMDVDAGEAVFVVQNAVVTQYGQFSIDAHGVWTYTVDNSKPEVQALKPGGTAGETGDISGALAQVLSQSGVAGFHSVGEALTQGQLSALAGVLDLSIQGAAIVLSGPAGTTPVVYAMDAQGRANMGVDELLSWLHQGAGYEIHLQGTQSDVQVFVHDRGDEHTLHALPLSGAANLSDPLSQALHLALQWHTPPVPGELHEIVTVSSADGTQHQINLTITGTAEDAVISGTDTGSVTEDANVSGGKLEAHGQLQITDADAGQAAFQPLQDLAGQYGHLTLGADGTWSYQADNQSAAIQALNKGQSLIDSFIVHSVDGTAHTIAVTLQGADEVRTDLLGLVEAKLISEYYYPGKQLAAAISSFNGGAVSSLELSFSNGTPKVVDATGHVLESFTSHDLFGTHVPLGHLLDLLKSHPGAQLILDGSVGSSSGYYLNNSGNPLQLNAFGLTRYNVANNPLGSAPIDGIPTPHVVVTNSSNSAAVLSGADSGSVLTLDATHELTQGHLTVLDADGGQAAFVAQQHVQGQYGQFDIEADGEWHYHADSTLDAVKHLVAGQALTDQFTVQSVDGTTHQISVQLFGAHQMAQISGVDQGQVTEDQATQLQANGQLTVSDPDPGEAHFIAQAHEQGRYGVFTLAADGQWTYTADSSQTAIQQLKAGASLTDVLTVQSVDGTTHAISVTINGSNDAAVIGGVSTGQVSEDATTRIQGQLTITDADQGEAAFQAQSNTHGSYGLLSIDEHGLWSYTVDNTNSTVQALRNGQSLTEHLTVHSVDGTAHAITVTINGSNDAAVIGGVSTGRVAEDANAKIQGQLTISDADLGEAAFQTQSNTHGLYGLLSLDSHGLWSYTLDNANSAVQALRSGQSLTEHLTVHSVDGTSHDIVISIDGRNDAPVLTAQSQTVTEDGALLSGKMAAHDPDAGDALHFSVSNPVAGFTLNADGSYTFDPSHAAYQGLHAGETRDVVIPITVTDSAGAHNVQNLTLHVLGQNDAAVIGGDDKGTVQIGALTQASGQLQISDADTGQAQFHAGQYKGDMDGSLALDAQGHWQYQLNTQNYFVQHVQTNAYTFEQFTVQSADGTSHQISIQVNGPATMQPPVMPSAGHDIYDGVLAAVRQAGYQYQGLADELDKGSLAAIGNMDLSISGVHVQVMDRAGNLVQRISSTGENAATLHMSDLLLWHAQGHSIIATSDSGSDTTRMWLHNTGDMHNIQVRLPDGTGFNGWADQWMFGELHLQGIHPAPPPAPAPAPIPHADAASFDQGDVPDTHTDLTVAHATEPVAHAPIQIANPAVHEQHADLTTQHPVDVLAASAPLSTHSPVDAYLHLIGNVQPADVAHAPAAVDLALADYLHAAGVGGLDPALHEAVPQLPDHLLAELAHSPDNALDAHGLDAAHAAGMLDHAADLGVHLDHVDQPINEDPNHHGV